VLDLSEEGDVDHRNQGARMALSEGGLADERKAENVEEDVDYFLEGSHADLKSPGRQPLGPKKSSIKRISSPRKGKHSSTATPASTAAGVGTTTTTTGVGPIGRKRALAVRRRRKAQAAAEEEEAELANKEGERGWA
jgi:hypothetical protein